jgi:hypothetical protein
MSRSKARNYRALSLECKRQAELAFEEPRFREMQLRLAKSYAALAATEDWLDGAEFPLSPVERAPAHSREMKAA